jgi:threonine dehydrogenase-like Zn-dependent dehydrogenase
MTMDEQQLRAVIRSVVDRRLGRGMRTETALSTEAHEPLEATHVSHHVYVTLVNGGDACLIEPSVPCNHCNFCKSHGH